MKYYIKTSDNEWWVGCGGEYLTKLKEERWVLDELELAEWYIENTNLFGELEIINDK